MKKILLFFAFVLGVVTFATAQQVTPGCIRTYTSSEDFEEGFLLSVNTSVPGTLRLDQPGQPLPFVNIACSGKGTVVRINVQTGAVVGEYTTAPDGLGKNPSRTTVDKFGNVWVTNRDESGLVGGLPRGSVTRIGVILGGTRCDAFGVEDPNGQYLKPPFLYNTCVDRNGDGLIKTSRGLGDVLSWNNILGANTNGGVTGAEDEAIINYTRVLATGARTIAIDEFNDAWVGGSTNRYHEKVSGSSGLPVAGTAWNIGQGGYGGFIDGNGILWSSGAPGNPLVRFDPNGPSFPSTSLISGAGDYGLGVDPNTGEVWHTFVSGGTVGKLSPSGALIGTYSHGSGNAQGCAVDAYGNVWVAHSLLGPSSTVGHLRTDGTFVGNVSLPGSGPTGVAVDAFGKVWVTCYNSDIAVRIDPNAGPVGGGGVPVGAVDLVVPLGGGASPYNYSDMTGFVVINSTVPSGTWTVVHDGLAVGRKWGQIDWNDSIPAQTGIRVEARASDQLLTLASKPFVEVQKGLSFCCAGVTGRYIEVRVTLFRQATVNITPVLFDLTVQCCDIYPNTLPVISSSRGCGVQDTLRIPAGQPSSFTVTGSDADAGQFVTLDVIDLPTGAVMSPALPDTANPITSTFSWTPNIGQLGIYNVRFTANDIYCYEAACDRVIEVVPCPSISCSGAGISCAGLCNGMAEVALSGNPPGFTFQWSTTPVKTSTNVYNLCPGTYTVYSSDNFACFDSCTIVIPATPCDGYKTFTQGGYGATPNGNNPGMYVKNNFNQVFPSGLVIGCTNTLKLVGWQAVTNFLPSGGTPRALPAGQLLNPTTYKNTLAGQLVTATLSVAFDSANANFGPAAGQLGDLVVTSGVLRGYTVREVIAEANRKIGGCPSAFTFSQLNYALTKINENYDNGGSTNNCFLSCPIVGSGSLKISNDVLSSGKPDWVIMPNPATDVVKLELTALEDLKITVTLLDQQGKVLDIMYTGNLGEDGATTVLNYAVSNLPNGVYLVKLDADNFTDIKRLVISR